MSLHHNYLIVLSALFIMVFAIMVRSLATHRRAGGEQAARFSGPRGTVQCLWAMVPIAILFSIDLALIDADGVRRPSARQTITLAVAPPPATASADATSHRARR